MKILVIDGNALALDFCLRSMAEGHDVRWFIRDKEPGIRTVGEGLVPKTNDWKQWMRWAELIFLPDNAVYMRDLEWYRLRGFPIYGPSDESARWEMERQTGMDIFRKHKIPVLGGRTFTRYSEAVAFVKATKKRYVSKPSGDADKALSYVSKGPRDMIFMLDKWHREGCIKSPFILQEFVPGIEMAVGAWVGPQGFDSPWCENWEFKKLLEGDRGVATGEQGTVLRYTDKSLLADKVLAPLEEALVNSGHTGYVDVNCIIDAAGNPWPLEFTMRPGWPLFNIQQQLHARTAEWMAESLRGGVTRKNFSTRHLALGVVVTIPDYPYGKYPREKVSGIPLFNMEKYRSKLHPCELKMGMAPSEKPPYNPEQVMVSAGVYLIVGCGMGETVSEAKREAYKVVESLEIPNSPMWRPDIGTRLEKQLPKLHGMGYAQKMKF